MVLFHCIADLKAELFCLLRNDSADRFCTIAAQMGVIQREQSAGAHADDLEIPIDAIGAFMSQFP